MEQAIIVFIMPLMIIYLIYIIFIYFHISVAEPKEGGEIADLRFDPSSHTDIITHDIFSIIFT